jgi:signal transduction histidine kinase/predicted ATPase
MLTHKLPSFATRFIGRDSEVTQILGLVNDPACRLLTLTGQGGVGKTRLSIEVARQIWEKEEDMFSDGIYFVPLAPLASADQIALAIANALKITLSSSGTSNEQLIAHLRNRQLLLVLDNFEHVIKGFSLLSDLLDTAKQIKIIVTSRERLQLPIEQVFTVQGMTTPEAEQVNRIEDFDVLLLFQQVAEKVDYRFKITEDLKPCVIRICQLVGGMPLAIELAAAWVRALSCQIIRKELEQNFEILGDTLIHVPERHRSLRIVFEYSWNLLTDEERNIFQGLSVFRGGFESEAVERIIGATHDSLLSLKDKSLLQQDATERYQIHELLRQFAEEKLEQDSENEKKLRDQHTRYYAEFLEQFTSEFVVYDYELPAVNKIKVDLDNVYLMWDWAIAQQKFDAINRASDSLYHYFRLRNDWRKATTFFQKAVTLVEVADSFLQQDVLLVKLLSMLSLHAYFCGLHEFSEKTAQQGLSLARTQNMPAEEARCLATLGDIAIKYEKYDQARQYLEEGITLYESHHKTYEAQFLRLRLGFAYQNLGEYDLARQYYQQLIFTDKKSEADAQTGWALEHLAHLENFLENFAIGRQHSTDSVEIFERIGWLVGLSSAHKNLASAYYGLGQYVEARHHFRIALMIYVKRESHMNSLAVNIIARSANLLALEGNVARAVELASFVQQDSHTSDKTKTFATAILDELEAEVPVVVFQFAQECGASFELRSLAVTLIEEFNVKHTNEPSSAEVVSKNELELLQRVADGLASGELIDESLSEKDQENVRSLLDTVDALLEKEKSKVMATFMESASHDLRTPLTVISTSLYLLGMISEPDKKKQKISVVKEQVTLLQTLIENLLDMARLDGGQDFEKHFIDVNQLLIAIRETHQAKLTAERNLDIQFRLFDTPMMILADQEYLEQALLNIIENAFHYTLDGGTITVSTYFEAETIIIDVSDTGIGIAEDDLPHIFERFFRVDEARTERGRAGLGLAISKKIIEAHNGNIVVNSTLDQGSHFCVFLPQGQ